MQRVSINIIKFIKIPFYRLGAFDGINYKQYPHFSDRVKLITNHEGVDVILDCILGTVFNCNLESLGMDSRWIVYGAMGGVKISEANMVRLLNKRATMIATTLRNRDDQY